jgi:hypothetical protein
MHVQRTTGSLWMDRQTVKRSMKPHGTATTLDSEGELVHDLSLFGKSTYSSRFLPFIVAISRLNFTCNLHHLDLDFDVCGSRMLKVNLTEIVAVKNIMIFFLTIYFLLLFMIHSIFHDWMDFF